MRYKKALSSESAAGLLQTLVGKPVITPNKLAKLFDKDMRKAFKDSLSKALAKGATDDPKDTTETIDTEDLEEMVHAAPSDPRVEMIIKGLTSLAKAVAAAPRAPSNIEFENKHPRAKGGKFGSKHKAEEPKHEEPNSDDMSGDPRTHDPEAIKNAFQEHVDQALTKEDYLSLKELLDGLAGDMDVTTLGKLIPWIQEQTRFLNQKIAYSVDKAHWNEYSELRNRITANPDRADGYLTLLREANKFDVTTPDPFKMSAEEYAPYKAKRAMYRILAHQLLEEGVKADPTFPRFELVAETPPHVTMEKVEAYRHAAVQLGLKGADLKAQEFIVNSTAQTMKDFDSYDPYRDLTDEEVNAGWAVANQLMNYYQEHGPQIDGNLVTDDHFEPTVGNDWDRVLMALVRSSSYTIGDWFGDNANWFVANAERFISDNVIPDVHKASLIKSWSDDTRATFYARGDGASRTLFFGKALEYYRDRHGEDAAFNASKEAYATASQAIDAAIASATGDKWGGFAAGNNLDAQPILDFLKTIQPIAREYIAATVKDDLSSQGHDKRRDTFQTAFEGRWKEATLANIAKNSGNDLTGAETILRSGEPHEVENVMTRVWESWDKKEHDSFTIVPDGIFMVDRFAKHEQTFKEWAATKDHVQDFYHGTSHAASPLILAGGLRVPKNTNQIKTGSMFGNGIYLAPNASKSAQYGDQNFSRDEGTGVLIGVKASLGVTRDVVMAGDYAPQPHPIGPETNLIGEPLTPAEYDQIKGTVQEPILLVNVKSSGYVFAAYHDTSMAGRPTLTQYKRHGDQLVRMGDFPITKPAPTSNPKKDALLLMENAGKMIQEEYPDIRFDVTYDPVDSAMAYVKGSAQSVPVGPMKLIFGDRLSEKALEDIPSKFLEQTKLVLTSLADTQVPGYDGNVYFVGKGVSGQWWVAAYKKTNHDRLIFNDLKLVPPDPERDALAAKGSNVTKMLMLQFIHEQFPDTPDVTHLWNALDLDQIGRSDAGYDSVKGLSRQNGGNLKNDEYVVFEDAQVMPEFVISYTRARKGS